MSVDPKRPERVVQIEDDHFWERQTVCESFWSADLVIEDGGRYASYGRSCLLFYHLGEIE